MNNNLNDTGTLKLLKALIQSALFDLNKKSYREDAISFLKSDYLKDMCDTIRLDLKQYIRQQTSIENFNLIFSDFNIRERVS
jgi:hypothetical protein